MLIRWAGRHAFWALAFEGWVIWQCGVAAAETDKPVPLSLYCHDLEVVAFNAVRAPDRIRNCHGEKALTPFGPLLEVRATGSFSDWAQC